MSNQFVIEKDRHQLVFSFMDEGLEIARYSMFESGMVKVIIPNVSKLEFIKELNRLSFLKEGETKCIWVSSEKTNQPYLSLGLDFVTLLDGCPELQWCVNMLFNNQSLTVVTGSVVCDVADFLKAAQTLIG